MGAGSRELLGKMGYDVEWHEYPMQHSLCLEEVQDIAAWLRTIFQAGPS
jgi:phospholipase/carboxylesterase